MVTPIMSGCVVLSIQMAKTQLKGREQWSRLRKYSIFLQKELLKR